MINQKDTKGKLQLTLVPPDAFEQVAKVFDDGAKKYGKNNWKVNAAFDVPLYADALYRHLLAYLKGETFDPDTGSHHLAHVAANAMIILSLEESVRKPLT
jgi:hypothetical protein